MLASLNFTRSSLHNRCARIYRRETLLSEALMRRSDLRCSACGAGIARGSIYALSANLTRLCVLCYGDMPEPVARAAVRFETGDCVTVTRQLYREVCLYHFGAVVVIIAADGSAQFFKNGSEAEAFVDEGWRANG